MDKFQKNVECYNYMVLSSHNTCNVYTSLRSISQDIDVDYTTISKKMKNSLNNKCCFVAPKNEIDIYYYIVKFKQD
jgi:hypothetical protein|tara:strand:- start:86 stop:313 length:228 start_codon:yes stop_codon:yes gene_type:complete